MAGKTLIVVPTCGNELVDGELIPSITGAMRLNVGASVLVDEYAGADLAIVGGYRNSGLSEASVANNWLKRRVSTIYQLITNGGRKLIVRAKGKYSAFDMTDLAALIGQELPNEYDTLVLVTHPDHARYMKETLLACPETSETKIIIYPSGEPAPYSPNKKKILDWVYKHDPRWEKWHSWPLRVMANRRENPR